MHCCLCYFIGTPKIETDRLILRRVELSDALKAFDHWLSDERVSDNVISKEKDINKIKSLFKFFERMATKGDDDVKELLGVTILPRLGDSKKLL